MSSFDARPIAVLVKVVTAPAWGPVVLLIRLALRRRKAARQERRERDRDERIARRYLPGQALEDAPERAPWSRRIRRRRRQLAPVPVAFTVAVARPVVPLAPWWAEVAWWLTVLAAAGWWGWKVKDSRRRLVVLAVLAALAWWLLPLPLVLRLVAWLLIVAGAVGARFRHFRIRPAAPPPPPGEADLWAATIGARKHPDLPDSETGALPGSMLRGEQRVVAPDGTDLGWEADWYGAVSNGKAQTISQLRKEREEIGARWGVQESDVIIEEVAGGAGRAHLTVIEHRLLEADRPWTGAQFDPDTGRAYLATFPDAVRAYMQAHVPGQGIRHGWFFGATQSGKSSGVETWLGSIMATPITVLDCVDLGEASLTDWEDLAEHWGVTVADGVAALRRANAVLNGRRTWRREHKQKVIHISPQWPMYRVLIEEWPELTVSAEAMKLADRIGRLGRKEGVAIDIVSQGCDLSKNFPGCDWLRSQIQQGNVAGFRSDDGAGGMAFGGAIKVNLAKIPSDKPGTAVLMAPGQVRDVTCRFDRLEDSATAAGQSVRGRLNDVDLEALDQLAADLQADRPALTAVPDVPRGLPSWADDQFDLEVVAAVRQLAEDGAELTTGNVHKVMGGAPYDRVRKALKRLSENGSPIGSPGHGHWSIAS